MKCSGCSKELDLSNPDQSQGYTPSPNIDVYPHGNRIYARFREGQARGRTMDPIGWICWDCKIIHLDNGEILRIENRPRRKQGN